MNINLIRSTTQIVERGLTRETRDKCYALAKKQGVLNSRTLVAGEGSAAGFAGQELLQGYAPTLVDHSTTETSWDFCPPSGQPTIDVKTKGNCKHIPALHFDCTVPVYQVEQQACDYYVFSRTTPELTGGWLLGFIEKARFMKEAQLRVAGSAYNNAGRRTIGNHLVILISRLFPMESFAQLIGAR